MSTNDTRLVEIFPLEPWAKTLSETDREYQMFRRYIDTPSYQRVSLLPILAHDFQIDEFEVKQIAQKHKWPSRAVKFDVWMDATWKQGQLERRRELGMEMVHLSKEMMKKAERAMKILEDKGEQPTYREAVEMARLGIELQKAGFTTLGLNREVEYEAIGGDKPQDLIAAAIQVGVIIKRQVQSQEIREEDVVDGTVIESDADGNPG